MLSGLPVSVATAESSFGLDISFLPEENMTREAKRLYQGYISADPYPHVVVDNFFDPAILDSIVAEFPGPRDLDWLEYRDFNQVKLGTRGERDIPIFTRHFLYSLNSSTFVDFLETVTGIEGLIPDPHLDGGGLHQIPPGGRLAIHSDFNRHDRLKLDRRLNLLLYLNKDWKEEYGGHFELWDRDLTACRRRLLPIFNRMVIFGTTDYTYHGHPDPITCPPGMTRKSIALYYFSNGRPAAEVSGKHSTLWQRRPGEVKTLKQNVRDGFKAITPPIIVKAVRSFYQHRRR